VTMGRFRRDQRGEGMAGYLIALLVAAAILLPVLWQLLWAVRDLVVRFMGSLG